MTQIPNPTVSMEELANLPIQFERTKSDTVNPYPLFTFKGHELDLTKSEDLQKFNQIFTTLVNAKGYVIDIIGDLEVCFDYISSLQPRFSPRVYRLATPTGGISYHCTIVDSATPGGRYVEVSHASTWSWSLTIALALSILLNQADVEEVFDLSGDLGQDLIDEGLTE